MKLISVNKNEIAPHKFRLNIVNHLQTVIDQWKNDLKGCYSRTEDVIKEYKDNTDDFSLGMLENLKR